MRKVLKVSAVYVLIFLTLCISVFTVSADSFDSYIYNSDKEVTPAPSAAEVAYSATGSFAGTTDFDSPQGLFISKNGRLYVADKGNDRIVILDGQCRYINEIKGFKNGDKFEAFKTPYGVFEADNGDIYVCDSGNYRIVVLDKDYNLQDTVTLEKGDSLPQDFVFKPVKIAVDASYRMFVVSEGFANGLFEFTKEGDYVRYMGASKVSLTPMQMFWRMFSTKEQREKTSSNVSAVYNNVDINDEGFLFVTSSAFSYWEYASGKAQPLRKLNAKGQDVLVRLGSPTGDISYPDSKTSRSTYKGPSVLVDVCMLPYGNYAVLDQNRGRIFAYNSDGEFMYEVAGPGNLSGGINTASALEYYDGRFYALDSIKCQINVYELTEYGVLFEKVAKASSELNYAEEEKLWRSISNENVNCTLAMRGLGSAAYRRQDMTTAMEYFKKAKDTEGYSKAFVFVRRQFIEQNAVWLILIAVAITATAIFISRLWAKYVVKSGVRSYPDRLNFASFVVFHPIKGFWELKREKRGSVTAGLTIFMLALAVKVVSSVATGFLFDPNGTDGYNILTDVLLMLAILLLFSISQWCVTVLMSGEGSFKEILTATCYCFTPYVFLTVIATLASGVLSLEEAELYTVLIAIGVAYTVFLMFMSIMATHDYTVLKTVLVTVIIIISIMLILFVAMLLITLTQQMLTFFKDVYNEITLRL
ncbi:MAG: YIP1 family protein [Clostridia bacterium]|nr:YIP1 family protein [Clostridia bacterium]